VGKIVVFVIVAGERPFRCRVCNMSFTTNGNMHRHTRIHTKEADLTALGMKVGSRRGKGGAWRQKVNYFVQGDQTPLSSESAVSLDSAPVCLAIAAAPSPGELNLSQDSIANIVNNVNNVFPPRRQLMSITDAESHVSSLSPSPVVTGVKRPAYSMLGHTPDWMVPVRRQKLMYEGEMSPLVSPSKRQLEKIADDFEQQVTKHISFCVSLSLSVSSSISLSLSLILYFSHIDQQLLIKLNVMYIFIRLYSYTFSLKLE
jgi:hypothetical protein